MSAVKNPVLNSASKKKSGGILRQAKSRRDQPADVEPLTEDDLLQKDIITPDDVLRLNRITESKYMIFFLNYFYELRFNSQFEL